MKWIRFNVEEPKNYQHVLIVKRGEYYVATYVTNEKLFHCKDGSKIAADHVVMWTQLTAPVY